MRMEKRNYFFAALGDIRLWRKFQVCFFFYLPNQNTLLCFVTPLHYSYAWLL